MTAIIVNGPDNAGASVCLRVLHNLGCRVLPGVLTDDYYELPRQKNTIDAYTYMTQLQRIDETVVVRGKLRYLNRLTGKHKIINVRRDPRTLCTEYVRAMAEQKNCVLSRMTSVHDMYRAVLCTYERVGFVQYLKNFGASQGYSTKIEMLTTNKAELQRLCQCLGIKLPYTHHGINSYLKVASAEYTTVAWVKYFDTHVRSLWAYYGGTDLAKSWEYM